MATGTIVYNKDQQQIYPISDGAVIISNASGSKSNVEDDLKKLFKQVSDLSGSSEAVNSIIIKIHYLPANTADESEIKLSSKQWSDTFELPTEENPYIWKRTKFTFRELMNHRELLSMKQQRVMSLLLYRLYILEPRE